VIEYIIRQKGISFSVEKYLPVIYFGGVLGSHGELQPECYHEILSVIIFRPTNFYFINPKG
jgi:hypothetical protein